MKKRMIALLLALAMLLGLFGCTDLAAPSEPALSTTESTEKPTADGVAAYEAVCEELRGADVTLDVVTTKTTTIGDMTMTEDYTQVLTYAGGDISLEETVSYWDMDIQGMTTATDVQYREVYADGVLYIKLENQVLLSAELTEEEVALRYAPAVLLDSSLYEDMTFVAASGKPVEVYTFSDATAGESWAVPAEAELIHAEGKVIVNEDRTVQFTYTAEYNYGPVRVEQTTVSTTRQEAETVVVPENTEKYTRLDSADALRIVLQTTDLLSKVDSATIMTSGSMYSQAGAVITSNSEELNVYGKGEDMVMRSEYSAYLSDFYNDIEDSYEQETSYKDGVYTLQEGDSIPTTWTTVDIEVLENSCLQTMQPQLPEPKYWQNVTVEDLGSLYYLEFTFNENQGAAYQNSIAETFWDDATFMNQLATAYTTDEVSGYLSVDKYTGLLVASGVKYQGTHVIDGQSWIMTLQDDQSVILPSFGAYKEVTDALPPEAEPEQRATPLFYRVTGEDGQEMWLLGTIHVGDSRTAYLPQEIYDAFAASDALALECDTEAFDEQMEEDEKLQEQVSNLYFYTDGSVISEHIDEELYTQAVKYLRATGNYNMNAEFMKPSVWSSSIENFFLQQGHTLTSEQGVEERLTKLAHEQEKEILEVESSIFQIEMTTGWSEDLQEQLLSESLEYTGAAYYEGVYELYELWCAGDEETLRLELSTQVDTSELTPEELEEYEANKELYEEYNTSMSTNRNEGMLQKAIEYLESGDVIFFAVGLAHLLDDTNGLVDTLREAGYTVELVSYG